MKYLLVIGIEFKFFRRPADVTIYVGNKFIDTFQLDRDLPVINALPYIESKWYEKYSKKHWVTSEHSVSWWSKLPSLYKVYEIDDSDLVDQLQIHVQNDNSDFTNGFMKNSSLIRFASVSLFKKDLISNRGEKMMKAIVRLCDGFAKHQKRTGKITGGSLSEPRPGVLRSTWPNANSFWVSGKNESNSGVRDSYWWVGGSFTAEFMIKTKYQMKVFGPVKGQKDFGFAAYTHPNATVLATNKKLLNIYDEDQRSNRTKD